MIAAYRGFQPMTPDSLEVHGSWTVSVTAFSLQLWVKFRRIVKP